VYTPIAGFNEMHSERNVHDLLSTHIKRTQIPEIFAFHPLGTCRMAGDSTLGVVDDCGKVFNTENVYIADGSIVPTSLGVNPQITIMALTTKISQQLADNYKSLKL